MAKDTAVCEMPNSSAMSFRLTRCVTSDDDDASRADLMNTPFYDRIATIAIRLTAPPHWAICINRALTLMISIIYVNFISDF